MTASRVARWIPGVPQLDHAVGAHAGHVLGAVHAQSLKPGVQMPDLTLLSGEDLNARLAYLLSLR